MDEQFSLELPAMLRQAGEDALKKCNAMTARFGLTLTPAEISELAGRQLTALRDTGRVEFGEGVLQKLVHAFCDSPYFLPDNYAETLAELLDAFYWFKNESEDRIPDDELIEQMRAVFDGRAQGSAEYLSGLTPEELSRYARGNWDPEDADDMGDLF